MSPAFDLVSSTHIESGQPLLMHRQRGPAIIGERFRLDVREYHWDHPVVSSGTTCYLHILSAFADARSQSAGSSAHSRSVPVGNIILIPPHQQTVFKSPAGYQRFVSLIIDPAMVPVVSSIEWTPEKLEKALNIRHPRVQALMFNLTAELRQPSIVSSLMVEGILLQLVAELCRLFSVRDDATVCSALASKSVVSTQSNNKTGTLSTKQLRSIVTLVDQCQFAPGLVELANSCGISSRHLTRLFKQTMGRTLGQFILERQILRARGLLHQEDRLIKQVAYQCGFRSTAAFTVAFRRLVGITPSQYRSAVIE